METIILSPTINHRGKRRRDPVANRRHQRDWYYRKKNCQAVFGCDADDRVLDMLVDLRYLAAHERDTNNAREIKLAITVFLADHARVHRAKK